MHRGLGISGSEVYAVLGSAHPLAQETASLIK